MCAVLGSARRIGAISRAPISRRFVAQRIAIGASYSSIVSAYTACVLGTTSNPSSLSASPSRFAKYTLLSISRIRGRLAGALMAAPPARQSRTIDSSRQATSPALPDSAHPGFRRRPRSFPRHTRAALPAAAAFRRRPVHIHRSLESRSVRSPSRTCAAQRDRIGARENFRLVALDLRRTPAQCAHGARSLPQREATYAGKRAIGPAAPTPPRCPPARQAAAFPPVAVRRSPVADSAPTSCREGSFALFLRRLPRLVEPLKFFRGQKTRGANHRNHQVVQIGQSAIPIPLVASERSD